MSEQDRARLYDWLREQAGEQEAEYLMSCIASVPLTELATKDSVERLEKRFNAELPKLATKDSVERLEKRFSAELPKLATKDSVERVEKSLDTLDTKVDALDTKVTRLETTVTALDTKVDLMAARQAEDRQTSRARHFWLAGIGLSAAVPIWLGTVGVIG